MTMPWPAIVAALGRHAVAMVAALSPNDAATLKLARLTTMRNKPRARRHLDHYLRGGGGDLLVNTASLLAEDPGVRGRFATELRRQLAGGDRAGRIAIGQSDYANQEWRYALGGITLHWTSAGGRIGAWFRDRYAWHPRERRLTQALHAAARRLTATGAREFTMIGRRVQVRVEGLQEQAARQVPGLHGRLLL